MEAAIDLSDLPMPVEYLPPDVLELICCLARLKGMTVQELLIEGLRHYELEQEKKAACFSRTLTLVE